MNAKQNTFKHISIQLILGVFLVLGTSCTKEINGSADKTVGSTSVGDRVECFVTDLYNGGWTMNSSETFPFSCTHNNGKTLSYECQLNGGSWDVCAPPNYVTNIPTSGLYNLRVRATDPGGTQGISDLVEWKTDLDDPIINTLAVTNNAPNNTQISFTGDDAFPGTSASSGFWKFQCKLDGVDTDYVDCASPKQYTNLSPSTNYNFSLKALDNAGNDVVRDDVSFTTQSGIAPGLCQIIAPFPPNPSSDTNATLNYSCTVPAGTTVTRYECRVDSGAWSNCTGTYPSYSISSLSNGSHTFEARYIDDNGAASNPSAPYTWVVNQDTTAPVVNLSNLNFPTGGGSQITFSSDDPNATYQCLLVGVDSSYVNCSSPVHYANGDTPGNSYTFYVRATDPSGNSSTAYKTWTNGNWGAFPDCSTGLQCGETKWVQRLCNVPMASSMSANSFAGMNCQGDAWKWCKRTCTTYKVVNQIYTTTDENICAWNQDCNHGNFESAECQNGMNRYCTGNSWWNASWGATNISGSNIDVACLTAELTDVMPVATNTISSNGCDPSDGYSAECIENAKNTCVNAGHVTGYGAMLNNDNSSYSVVCMKADSGELKNTTFTNLAVFNSSCSIADSDSTECINAMTLYCQSLDANLKTGIGPYNVSGDDVDVYCVYHEIEI